MPAKQPTTKTGIYVRPPPLEPARRLREVSKAFEAVFGQAGRRSADQELVLRHLQGWCRYDEPAFIWRTNDHCDPLRAAHVDGARTTVREILAQLAAAALPEPEPLKPILKKGAK
jgi:hypothetical protein